jgi:hypothetical protein
MRKSAKKTKNLGGRPRTIGPGLVLLTFKADPATLEALAKITAALAAEPGVVGMTMNGGRSTAIRRSILETAARLDNFTAKEE